MEAQGLGSRVTHQLELLTRSQLQFDQRDRGREATPLCGKIHSNHGAASGRPPTFHLYKQEKWRTEFHLGSLPPAPPQASFHPLRKQERFFPAFPGRVCSCNLQTRGPAPVCTVLMDGNQGPAWVSRQASLLLELGKPVGNWTRPTWGKGTKTRLPSTLHGSQRRFFIKESPDLSLRKEGKGSWDTKSLGAHVLNSFLRGETSNSTASRTPPPPWA